MDTSSLVYFDQQVAGHDKLMSIPTNDLIVIKPCKKKELDFYQDALAFHELLDFLPECYGTVRAATETELKLLDNAGLENDTVKLDTSQHIDHNLCLENVLHGFTRPCILDLKMGFLLYDNEATEEKRKRMIHKFMTTTSGSLGLKISGLKVYDTIERKYATYKKIYGESRTPENITDALLSYLFPTSSYGKSTEEYRTYIDDDKASTDIIKEKIPTKYARWVIECFIDTVTELKESIAEYPNLRLIGSSILFIYEGDRAAADATWKRMLEEDKLSREKEEVKDGEEAEELPSKMCDLRLIDFAHSDWHADADAQDPALLKGFDNIIKILKDCLKRQREEKF